ncbi:CHAP domain-containing protein [Leucobacter coleopterorum]|uniref:CHAP domain-containing protein n=1 Tax=Leucobacter coleopterorum TaxID=2714933 RepID=A0ABX6JU15_9MICO|nr:CHAP domain-containing protein [Leucobacter coleopterorum]QIM17787.1 CHAP domain-containing protein [Leucobacter coleopterorum]
MRVPAKAFVITLITSVTFAFGAAPSFAAEPIENFAPAPAAIQPATLISQTLDTTNNALAGEPIDSVLDMETLSNVPHNFDVKATIAQAESEVGTSRPTGWSQPGECIMSAQRWIKAGGGAWNGSGNPVANYDGATRMTLANAEPGDIVQYEYTASPTSWVSGIHTVLITEVHDDGTFTIIESNNPGGSGLVNKDEKWTPKPPPGFDAVVWRF